MPRVALLSLACVTCLAHAHDPSCLDEAQAEDAQSEREVLEVYERVWERSDYEGKLLLQRAQGAWLDYREANCDLFSKRQDGFSSDAHAQCVEFMSRERAAELSLVERTRTPDTTSP